MGKRALPLAIGAITIALVIGGMAFATELSPLGGADQAATAPIGEDAVAPLDGNSGQGAAHCSDATAHALDVLRSHQAAGKEVGNSIAAVEACGTGAGSEKSNQTGPPDWVPGPPPWAGANSSGASEGANGGGPPDWVPGPPPWAGANSSGASEGANGGGPPDWVPGPPPWAGANSSGASEGANGGGPPDWVPGPPPWAGSESPE